MSLVYSGVLSHAPGITGRAHLCENIEDGVLTPERGEERTYVVTRKRYADVEEDGGDDEGGDEGEKPTREATVEKKDEGDVEEKTVEKKTDGGDEKKEE